jgi:hypothetical protein
VSTAVVEMTLTLNGLVVVVGETVGELVQAARASAITTSARARNLTVVLS